MTASKGVAVVLTGNCGLMPIRPLGGRHSGSHGCFGQVKDAVEAYNAGKLQPMSREQEIEMLKNQAR